MPCWGCCNMRMKIIGLNSLGKGWLVGICLVSLQVQVESAADIAYEMKAKLGNGEAIVIPVYKTIRFEFFQFRKGILF